MTMKLRTQNDVAHELVKLYADARDGTITPKAADRLSRVLNRLKPLLPMNDLMADFSESVGI